MIDIDTNLDLGLNPKPESSLGLSVVGFVNLDNPPLHSVPIVDNWNLTTTLNK